MTAPDPGGMLAQLVTLRPRCDVRAAWRCPVHGVHIKRCDAEATAHYRTTCSCGHVTVELVCDAHAGGSAHRICGACHRIDAITEQTKSPL